MTLAKLGVVYDPAYLLAGVLLTGVYATVIFSLLHRLRNTRSQTRFVSALFLVFLALTIVQALVWLRIQIDPLYVRHTTSSGPLSST
jgi:hypothetical protein